MDQKTDIRLELIYRIGKLYALLATADGAHDGELTIAVRGADGERSLHVYIDGTDLQMSETPHSVLSFDVEASQ